MSDAGVVMCVDTYLKRKDPEFHEVVNELCMGGVRPHGRNGITFLLPTGEFRKSMMEKALHHPEEFETMLKACTFDMVYPTLADLHKAGAGKTLVNRLSQEVDLKVSGSEGVLSNGSKISKDPEFKASPSRPNMVVYLLNGPMPTNGKVVKMEEVEAKKAKKEGGAEKSFSRFVFARRVEEDFCLMMTGPNNSDNLKANPYVSAVGHLVHFLHKNKSAYEDECNKVCELLDANAISSFYILFEPYAQGSYKVLSDTVFQAYIDNAFCTDPAGAIVLCLNKSKNEEKHTETNAKREKVFGNTTIRETFNVIDDVYGNDMLKLARDEFRYMVDSLDLFTNKFDLDEFKSFTYQVCTKYNFKNPANQVSVKKRLNGVIRPQMEYFSGAFSFIRSTAFNYYPFNASESIGDFDDKNIDPTSTELINYNVRNRATLETTAETCETAAKAELENMKAKIKNCE
jgi:hypothetical protein